MRYLEAVRNQRKYIRREKTRANLKPTKLGSGRNALCVRSLPASRILVLVDEPSHKNSLCTGRTKRSKRSGSIHKTLSRFPLWRRPAELIRKTMELTPSPQRAPKSRKHIREELPKRAWKLRRSI